LFLLRLADRACPAMDQLYYYVRQMDDIVERLADVLNETEDRYDNYPGPNKGSKAMNYFMRSKDKNNIQELVESNFDDDASDDDGHDDDDDSRSNLIEEELEDDLESIQSDDETVDEDNRCGTFLKQAWTKRSRALRTDIAIAGWDRKSVV